jgi:hypothetical protein
MNIIILILLGFLIAAIMVILGVYYFAFTFFQSIFNSSRNIFITLFIMVGTFLFLVGVVSFNNSIDRLGTISLIGSAVLFSLSVLLNFIFRPKSTNIKQRYPVNTSRLSTGRKI